MDAASGIVHSVDTTTAKTHDSQVWDEPPRGDEKLAFADKAYADSERETASEENGGVFLGAVRKVPKGGELDACDESADKAIAKIRARVEHPFRVTERQFGHTETPLPRLG